MQGLPQGTASTTWQVAALPAAKIAAVLDLADHKVVPDLDGEDTNEAVIDVDALAGRQHLQQNPKL